MSPAEDSFMSSSRQRVRKVGQRKVRKWAERGSKKRRKLGDCFSPHAKKEDSILSYFYGLSFPKTIHTQERKENVSLFTQTNVCNATGFFFASASLFGQKRGGKDFFLSLSSFSLSFTCGCAFLVFVLFSKAVIESEAKRDGYRKKRKGLTEKE